MANNQPSLIFPPTSAKVGKPYSIAENWEISPRTACRELIQNALDAHAALPKQQDKPCKVIFKTDRIKASDIPEFTTYLEALAAGQHNWQGNPSVKEYLQSLQNYSKATSMDILYVSDNGIGFHNKTLEAVLAEGTPEKQAGSSGSFGIGHLTAFGLSGLQYIFYAGKYHNGKKYCAGHTILASFSDPKGRHRSNHGYFLNDYTSKFDQPYEFCSEQDIPPFLLKQLNAIETSGSVVAVLGFKGFKSNTTDERSSTNLDDIICEAVAENFAIAICADTLEVEVQTPDKIPTTIDRASIVEFLEWMARPDTGTKERTREAQLTLDAIETYRSHISGCLPDEFQDCQIYLRNQTRTHSVSIWRNGMLITRKHRGLSKGMFDNKKPLNAVICLSGQKTNPVAHDLVKKAETPMHDRIEEKRLASIKEKTKLKNFFNETRRWIMQEAIDSGGKSLHLNDEIQLDTGTTGLFKFDRVVRPSEGAKTSQPPDPSSGPSPEPKPKPKVTRKNIAKTKIQGRYINQTSYVLRIFPIEDIQQAILQVTRDNGQDPSCTSLLQETLLEINEATIYGDPKRTLEVDIKSHTVELGDLKKSTPVDLKLIFSQPLTDINTVSLNCTIGKLNAG